MYKRQVVNTVNLKIKELSKKKVLSEDAKIDEKSLKTLVKAALIDKDPDKNQLLNKLKSSGVKGIGNSAKKTKRIAIAGAISVLLIILGFIFQDALSSLFTSVGKAVSIEKSTKDLYLEELREKEKNKPKFTPKMTKDYKTRYVDNVIYTESFMKIWPSDKFQKKWIIELTDYITNDLRLPDYKVVPYISEELKLVNGLINLRKKIRPETKTVRISEMRALEEKAVKKLKQGLGSDQKYQKLQKHTKQFFLKYRNSF